MKKHNRWKWALLILAVILALAALWGVRTITLQIEQNEKEKVRIWANAISQKNRLMSANELFFNSVSQDEHRKMELYTKVLKTFAKGDLGTDVDFCLAYVNYIMDSTRMATIITDRRGIITSCRNIVDDTTDAKMIGQPLDGPMLEQFSINPPFHYRVWNMSFTLYYRESKIYSDMRQMLNQINESVLADIANNTVFVPVIVMDSTRTHILASGNVDSSIFTSPTLLEQKLHSMRSSNEPIEILLPDMHRAFVYYESTPQLRTLHWLPFVYVFIGIVLLIVVYYLFRTSRKMQQNQIWVGLAKETAHQLGTPISSLIAWTDYLEGKTLEPSYTEEIRKDLSRLETVTHRFSKIGATPELSPADVGEAIQTAISYLEKRAPRKIKFITQLPNEPMVAPLNSYLFGWVIENICKNAIDAMGGDGTFSIVAEQDEQHIYIDLSDTGKGILPANQKHIFDSGFTTKERGWGLGLSLARRIINEHHRGKLFLKYSMPGQGSVFRIVLNK